MLSGLLDPLHLVILLAIVLLVVGPRRLPELGSSLGKTLRMFKDAQTQDKTRDAVHPSLEDETAGK